MGDPARSQSGFGRVRGRSSRSGPVINGAPSMPSRGARAKMVHQSQPSSMFDAADGSKPARSPQSGLPPPLDPPRRLLNRSPVSSQPVNQLLRLVPRYAGAHGQFLDCQDVGAGDLTGLRQRVVGRQRQGGFPVDFGLGPVPVMLGVATAFALPDLVSALLDLLVPFVTIVVPPLVSGKNAVPVRTIQRICVIGGADGKGGALRRPPLACRPSPPHVGGLASSAPRQFCDVGGWRRPR